jgi:chromosome segregation ATPase
MDEGFIDLRHAGDYSTGGDSFWPSFTDIMMVVVMIFMITSTILMLRNWELVRELRATIVSEREARAQAQSATRTSATLEERLAQAQSEISELRMQLMRSNEQNQSTNRELVQARQQLRTMESDRQGLEARLRQSATDLRLVQENLQQKQDELSRLNSDYATMQQLEQVRSDELATLRAQYSESELQLTNLQGTYDELSVKYNKLVKPARTAIGKYLVSVRYRKENGKYQLEFKEMEGDEYQTLSRKELDKKLSALKDEYSGALYVKVIIPKDSGLSYNEAWGFTQDILTSYDYYYQE